MMGGLGWVLVLVSWVGLGPQVGGLGHLKKNGPMSISSLLTNCFTHGVRTPEAENLLSLKVLCVRGMKCAHIIQTVINLRIMLPEFTRGPLQQNSLIVTMS